MTTAFQVGFGEVDITPPEGLLMCGGLDPRVNAGTDDPLMAKAVVVTGDGTRAAVVGVDLVGLPRAIVDQIIDETAGSGGDLLPWMFRRFKLGKLVGKRTWGGLVGVLGYPVLMDGGYISSPNLAFFT